MVEIKRSKAFTKRNKKKNDELKSHRAVQVGDLVFLRNHAHSDAIQSVTRKMLQLYIGPYVCSRKLNDKVVELIEPRSGRIIGHQSTERCRIWKPTMDTRLQWLELLKDNVPADMYQDICIKQMEPHTGTDKD